MCLILLALEPTPEFTLVLASNRDEFYDRPTAPMHWWPDRAVLAGRDQRSGGTWLAIRRDGSLAMVTNYRSGTAESGKCSRGEIPLKILDQGITPNNLGRLYEQRRNYSGFNLLAGNGADWLYCGSEDTLPYRRLHRGIYGLSNQLLQSDWPKVHRGRRLLQQCMERHVMESSAGRHKGDDAASQRPSGRLHQCLIEALQDETPAADELLPETGVGLPLERLLSPLFIRGETYGTRATTVVTVDHQGQAEVTEQQYGSNGTPGPQQTFAWRRPD